MKTRPILVIYTPLLSEEQRRFIETTAEKKVKDEYIVLVVGGEMTKEIGIEVFNADALDPIDLDSLIKKLNGEQEQDKGA